MDNIETAPPAGGEITTEQARHLAETLLRERQTNDAGALYQMKRTVLEAASRCDGLRAAALGEVKAAAGDRARIHLLTTSAGVHEMDRDVLIRAAQLIESLRVPNLMRGQDLVLILQHKWDEEKKGHVMEMPTWMVGYRIEGEVVA